MQRKCTKCQVVKPVTEFRKLPLGRDGLQSNCRSCQNETTKRWREKHPDYYSRNRQRITAAKRAYYATHREEEAARNARWYETHREEAIAKMSRYQAAHRKEIGIRYAAWQKLHPELTREYAHRRRARLREVAVEPVDMAVLYARDSGRCGICNKAVARACASMDHVLPLSQGGAHSYANTRIAHLRCNIARGWRGAAQLRLI